MCRGRAGNTAAIDNPGAQDGTRYRNHADGERHYRADK
nr:MAG TPA: hypothetical protein [Caudoviricetes sp.]